MVTALVDRRRAALTLGALTAGQGRIAVSLHGRPIALWWTRLLIGRPSPCWEGYSVQTSTDRYWILGAWIFR